ncbi:MAG: hypothetical protein AUG51_23525 [Acidobacteria bacterium 13_1_20CM_3_53_8]|nr:MAG: hypothetical protein AUG51_23525 [Acidobacteria bacterium 13_1_20CM_3_53_8]
MDDGKHLYLILFYQINDSVRSFNNLPHFIQFVFWNYATGIRESGYRVLSDDQRRGVRTRVRFAPRNHE